MRNPIGCKPRHSRMMSATVTTVSSANRPIKNADMPAPKFSAVGSSNACISGSFTEERFLFSLSRRDTRIPQPVAEQKAQRHDQQDCGQRKLCLGGRSRVRVDVVVDGASDVIRDRLEDGALS